MLIDLAQSLTSDKAMNLSTVQSMVLAECFETAFTFAHDFNRNHRSLRGLGLGSEGYLRSLRCWLTITFVTEHALSCGIAKWSERYQT